MGANVFETLMHRQCDVPNVCALVFVLAAHGASMLWFRDSKRGSAICWVLIAVGLINVLARKVETLTVMHQIMGMMASEAAVRVMRQPLFRLTSCIDLLVAVIVFIPNFLIVMGETLFALRWDPSFHIFWHESFYFVRTPFYKKQHAFLHATLCVLTMSVATSYWPKWRHSIKVQQARMFVEPACLVTVAMILMTHHHGAEIAELATHPVIGTLMCLAAFLQLRCCAMHLEVKTTDGSPPDLTAPLPGGGPPSLRMSRLVAAYAYLVLAFFLYEDTIMEYLGCRSLRNIPGMVEIPDTALLGLSPGSELSTYLSLSVISAALFLGCLILGSRDAAPSTATRTATCESEAHLQALLISEQYGMPPSTNGGHKSPPQEP